MILFHWKDLVPGGKKKRKEMEKRIREQQEARQQKLKEEEEYFDRISETVGFYFHGDTHIKTAILPTECEQIYYHLEIPRCEFIDSNNTLSTKRKIIYDNSELIIKNVRFYCSDPVHMVVFVNKLRCRGIDIPPNQYEAQKKKPDHVQIKQDHESFIYHRYKDDPHGFEYFCADLFEKAGYSTHVTQAIADGGYDIEMSKSGVKTIVECKCYKKSNIVGRPYLQKLAGANVVEKADNMMFITTSSFSEEAIEYAKNCPMKLIDGNELILLCSKYGIEKKPNYYTNDNSDESWWLTRKDLEMLYPPNVEVSPVGEIIFCGMSISMEEYLMPPEQRKKEQIGRLNARRRAREEGFII